MQYIYDIILNFNYLYYDFYEWKKSDKIVNVKKIPAFKVSSDFIHDFKYNDVIISKDFVDNICDVATFYKNVCYRYICLFSDGNESIGVMFNKNGKLIKRSSLLLDEDDEVNEELSFFDVNDIAYTVSSLNDVSLISRIDRDKREYLYKYIVGLNVEKDFSVLKYIYYDFFEEECDDIDFIKNKLIEAVSFENNNKLYNLVKMLKEIKNS